nr:hypothetical protein GCM10020185_46230 [Pseudomonas brassicacearum subsp. brassicacearum]
MNAKLGLMDDSDYLRLLTIAAEQANAFLSNARKWERERWVCQRLLQGLNVPYRADEFAPAGEPPDVLFRDANFEVFFSCSTRAAASMTNGAMNCNAAAALSP